MPKAAIYEHRHSKPWEDDVSSASRHWQRMVDPEAVASAMDC
jgi:hypothetical protein